jgi:hypothetical protein
MSERPTNAELMAETMKVIRHGGSEGAVWSREAARARASEDEKDAQIKVLADALEMWVGTERGHTLDCGSTRDDERDCSAECRAMRIALRAVGRV